MCGWRTEVNAFQSPSSASVASRCAEKGTTLCRKLALPTLSITNTSFGCSALYFRKMASSWSVLPQQTFSVFARVKYCYSSGLRVGTLALNTRLFSRHVDSRQLRRRSIVRLRASDVRWNELPGEALARSWRPCRQKRPRFRQGQGKESIFLLRDTSAHHRILSTRIPTWCSPAQNSLALNKFFCYFR